LLLAPYSGNATQRSFGRVVVQAAVTDSRQMAAPALFCANKQRIDNANLAGALSNKDRVEVTRGQHAIEIAGES
jgi:hypothetical protein